MGILETILLIAASAASLTIGLTVYSKNPKSVTHIIYGLLSLTLLLWSVANYFSLRTATDEGSLLVVRLIFICVVVQNSLFYIFTTVYPSVRKPRFSFKKLAFGAYSALLVGLIATGYVVTGFENGNVVVGPAIALFILHAGFTVIAGFRNLLRIKQTSETQKRQLIYGSLVLWCVVPVTNFVLPSAFDFTLFVRFSSLFVLLFNAFIAYAILRYKLFDIRSIVARASGYLLTLGIFFFAYVAVIAFINNTIFKDDNISLATQILYAVIAVLSAPLLVVMKRYFDKASRKVFYRDSYDAQVFISELNQALVNNVQLDSLLTKAALIIQESLKTSYCTFYIRDTSYFEARIIGAHRKQPEFEQLGDIEGLASKTHRKVIDATEEYREEYTKKLVKILKENDIDIMARLVSTLEFDVKGIGYIFIGSKQSGSPYSKQDLQILEIVVNELVIAVENILRFEEIEQFNVTLQKKIDDATKELKQTNQKLLALDEAKDEFVSMASHQLRTPLTSIKGYLSMVLEGDAGKVTDTQRDMLGQAFFSSQRMVYLISDLLNVSRLKTGKFIIESKPVYLPDLVESEVSQLQEGAKAKNITLTYNKPEKFPTLNLDEMKLRQVVMNFSDNAIYYTPQHGKIDIDLKDTEKAVEFRVKDSGIGVPPNEKHKLFTKFYRAENARKTRPDGTGLGLFMAKKVIVAQGGSVIFDSKEGQGSTFGFSFPKDKLLVEPPKTAK